MKHRDLHKEFNNLISLQVCNVVSIKKNNDNNDTPFGFTPFVKTIKVKIAILSDT